MDGISDPDFDASPMPNPDDDSDPNQDSDPDDDRGDVVGLAPVTDLEAEVVILGGDADQYIWGTAEDDLFLGSESGLLAHFDGERWRPFDLGPNSGYQGFLALFGFSPKDVFASTDDDHMLHYDGETWTSSNVPHGSSAFSIWGSAPDDVYAVTGVDLIHFDGSEWEVVETKLPADSYWTAVSGSGPDDVFITGSGGPSSSEPRAAHFDGVQWAELEVPVDGTLRDVWSAGSGTAFVVGSSGTILFFGGKTFKVMESGTYEDLRMVWGRSFGEVFAVGQGLLRRFDGNSWSEMEAPVSSDPYGERHVSDLFGFDGGGLVAAGQGVDRFEDGAWETLLPYAELVEDIWASDPDNVLFVGNVMHRYDGQRIEPEDLGSIDEPFLDCAWGSGETIYASGYNGDIFRYDGEHWGRMTSNTSARIFDMFGTSENDVFAVGEDGTILHFDGLAWDAQESGMATDLRGVWAAGPDDAYAVGDEGAILRYDGNAWFAMDSGDYSDFRQVIGFDAEHVVATKRFGGLLLGDGLTWRAPQAETEDAVINVRTLHGTASDNLFAASSGGLNHYDGDTWTQVTGESPRDPKAMFAVGPRELYVAGWQGVYRYTVPSP